MTRKQMIKLFGEKNIRTVWDDKEEKWYFSIVDVVSVLTDSKDPTAYWRKLKQRLKEEGNETVTNCHGLKLKAADGKMRMTDVADQEQLFRLIQSIPSPKAEPFKQWMAQVASTRVDQMMEANRSKGRTGIRFPHRYHHQGVEWHDHEAVQATQRLEEREPPRQYDES